MTDLISKEKRSYIMSMIKGKNTKPEIIVRKYLFHCGFRFRVNVKRLPGTPDIVLRKYKTAIFVNGCFWARGLPGISSSPYPGRVVDRETKPE